MTTPPRSAFEVDDHQPAARSGIGEGQRLRRVAVRGHDRPGLAGWLRAALENDLEPYETLQGHVPFVDGPKDPGAITKRERTVDP